jgi:hypothetical protein
VVVVVIVSVSLAGNVVAGSVSEPESPAAGGMVTGCGGALPAASGTLVAAAAGASVATAAGAVGVAVPVEKGGAVDDPPLHAASAANARKMGPANSLPVRKRIGMRKASMVHT